MGLPAWRLPAIANELRKLAARDAGAIRPFSWVPDIFARLRDAGVTIAMVSSNTESNIRRILGPVPTSEVGHYATGASLYGKATKIRQVIRKAGSTKVAMRRSLIAPISDSASAIWSAAKATGSA